MYVMSGEIVRPLAGNPTPPPTDARPFRPRPRAFAAPVGATALDRIRLLTAAGTAAAHGETVTLDPAEAAERILTTLREWGYI